MYWKITLLIIGFIFSTVINPTSSIKCYVCGDPSAFPANLQNYSNPLPCDDFEKSEGAALDKFIVECPKSNRGCMAQKQGNAILRACDLIAFDDCQSANGITYCYCSDDLCNTPGAIKLTTISAAYIDLGKVADLTDDEDYVVDMSGDGIPEDVDENDRIAEENDRNVDELDGTILIKGKIDSINSDRIDENESEKDKNLATTSSQPISKFSPTDDEDDSIQLVMSVSNKTTVDDATDMLTTAVVSNLDTFNTTTTTTTTSTTDLKTRITSSIRHVENTKIPSTRPPSRNQSCSSSVSKIVILLPIYLIAVSIRF